MYVFMYVCVYIYIYIYIHTCLIFVSVQPVCVFIGAFKPFTFKVIIDIYVPIVIFLIVWG